MKKMSHWSKLIALFALTLSAVGSLKTPATAVNSTTTGNNTIQKSEPASFQERGNFQLAQGLVGQCRAAKQRIFVYSQRSVTSSTVRTLAPNEQVTLADNGSAGWIAISAPDAGYVQAENLTKCSGVVVNPTPKPTPTPTPTPTPKPTPEATGSLCRAVTIQEGLAVRNKPDKSAPRIAGVYLGNKVTLKSDPPQYSVDSQGRSWVQITAPASGWISYGYPGTKSTNLGACP